MKFIKDQHLQYADYTNKKDIDDGVINLEDLTSEELDNVASLYLGEIGQLAEELTRVREEIDRVRKENYILSMEIGIRNKVASGEMDLEDDYTKLIRFYLDNPESGKYGADYWRKHAREHGVKLLE